MYGLAIVSVFALASCDSENEPAKTDDSLPAEISKDFYGRCPNSTIERVSTNKDFYSDMQETYVFAVDDTGDKYLVAYLDSAWNRTIRTITDITQLPYNVKEKLSENCSEAMVNGFIDIKEVAQKSIANKYYIFRYRQDTPLAANCEHTLVVDSGGTILKATTYMLNDIDYTRLYTKDIDWITEHYEGAVILGYVNDLGDDNYIVMHNGTLKSIYFNSNETEVRWNATKYELPNGEVIPSKVLEVLHTIDPEFIYTEVTVVETPIGKYYSLVDGTKPERPGHNIWLP